MKAIETRSRKLSERLLQVKDERFLDQIDEILMKAEMQARFEESLDDIANGRTITIDQLQKDCDEWMRSPSIGSR